MTTETNTVNNAPSDPFDFFLSLESDSDNKAIKNTMESLREERAAEKSSEKEFNADDYDFSSLGIEGVSEVQDESSEYDFSFLDESNPIFADEEGFIDPEATEEVEENDDSRFQEEEESDGENSNDDPDSDASDIPYGESVELDYTDLVTLPDGRSVTLEELANRYTNEQEFEERLKYVADEEARINQASETYLESLRLAQLEADYYIDQYKDVNWIELAQTDPAAYAEHNLLLNDFKAKKQHIIEKFIEQENKEKADKEAKFTADAKKAVQDLKVMIPEWSDALYSRILDHMISNGVPEEEAQREIRPQVIKAFYSEMKMKEGQRMLKAKVQRPKGATKSISPNSKNSVVIDHKKEALAKAYSQGKISNSDIFKFLED